ncbi:MAG: SGNH/GDSL hydrolase family protein, partial [Clostridia bacterium]|nr:SGNH/GDSL hydrolase family protein [Clostridia bacterium]
SGYGVTENDVIYTVNNNTVVSISGNKITSVATGSVTVTARLGVISKTFTVTVKATSEGDDAASPRTMDTDLPRHRNNMQGLSVFNYSGDLTLFMGASFMDERNFFTDFYTTRYPTKNAFLLGVAGSRTTHWRFFVQDYLSYAPKNIVLGVGGNDLFSGGFSAEDVTNNLERIFEVIHDALPSTNVYWWTSADRYNNAWQKQQEDKISAFNAGVRSYAEDKDWLTVVETRSLLTTQADYKETSGIRLHPSIPTGYDKCMQATVDAGLVLTDNAYAATNIVKDWTSINGTDDFGTVKVLGIQARATNFVWESDVTIKNFSNTGAKGHITINWKSVTAINGKTNGQNNRFVILNRNGDGRFFFSGNTASSGAWSADDAEYLTAVSGTDKTFRLAILATDKNAYMFIDGVLYATYRNITLENVKSDATYYAFRVGGELATVKFENNKISNPYINSANYNSYLENATVAANEGDTTLSSAKILYRKVTFNVYNDAHFTANGVSLNFTDTANNASYGETVENNKVSFVTGAAGEMIGKTYNVTANFTGLTASVYNGATVTHDGDNYLISGDTFSFSGMFANSNVTSWTSEGSAEVDLYNGVYKKLSGSVENNFALKVNITGSFYAAVYMKGDITSTAAETRFGFNYSGSNGNGGVTFLKNANKTFIGVQNMTYWKWYIDVDNETSESLSRTVLKNDGYWLIMHQDSSTGTRTVYVSDSTCNYLIRVAMTRTSDYYKNATVTQFGIDFWQNAFVMSASSFRVGATLQAALNKTVDISVTNTANCTATVSADSVAAGNEVTFAISPDKTYQVSSVTMNGIDITGTLNKGTFTFIALKDTVFTPAITFVGNKISIQDKTISGHGSGNKIDAYNGRIGLIGFTWQGFMGFPSGTSLDLSASAKWNVVVSFDTENGKAIQVQLLRWNGVVYIKAFINDSTNNAVRIDTNADLYAKLIADKGLTVRVIFDGDNISTYALGGENYNAWYKIHSNYQIANEGTYVNKISYYKDLSDIASLSAIVKEAAITTYKDAPTSWAVADATNSGSGTVSETTICTVPNYNENVFTWAGYIGFNVTDVSLFTDTAMWYSQVTFKDSANANVLALQLLGYNGNHYSKLQGSGLGNNTMSYKFHDVGGTNVGSYETYLTANGKLYISIAYDSLNKTASMWIRDNSGLLNKVYSDVTLPSCSGNKIATITWNSVGSPLSKVSASFVKGQSISFIDTTTPGEGGDFNTSELANYKIVYDADYPELNSVATTLRNNISSKYGIALP